MGIAVGRWDSRLWKETLAHHGRIARVCAEFAIAQDDEATFPYDGDLFGAFETSFVLAAFCIRRLSEKRLLTDALNEKKWGVGMYPSSEAIRQPYVGHSSNGFYRGYKFDKRGTHTLTLKELGHEIIHSSNLGIVTEEDELPIGIVVASDNRLSKRVLHISLDQWTEVCFAVLDDRVYSESDQWNPETGEITATREGAAEAKERVRKTGK